MYQDESWRILPQMLGNEALVPLTEAEMLGNEALRAVLDEIHRNTLNVDI